MTAGQIPNPNQNSTTAHLYDGKTVRAAAPSRKKAAGSMKLGTEIPKDANDMTVSQAFKAERLYTEAGNIKEARRMRVRIQEKFTLPIACFVYLV